MRKLLWNFSVIWTNCILACVKKDIIDAIEILEEEIDLVQGKIHKYKLNELCSKSYKL